MSDQQISTLEDLSTALDLAASAAEVLTISRLWSQRGSTAWSRLGDELIYDALRAFGHEGVT